MIFRRSFLAVAACALSLPVLAASHPAGRGGSVHLALSKSVPAPDEVVASPSELRFWYTDAPDKEGSSVQLSDEAGSAMSLGDMEGDPDDPKVLAIPVTGTLAPGGYVVAWTTLGGDGHEVYGRFSFTVGAN